MKDYAEELQSLDSLHAEEAGLKDTNKQVLQGLQRVNEHYNARRLSPGDAANCKTDLLNANAQINARLEVIHREKGSRQTRDEILEEGKAVAGMRGSARDLFTKELGQVTHQTRAQMIAERQASSPSAKLERDIYGKDLGEMPGPRKTINPSSEQLERMPERKRDLFTKDLGPLTR